MNGLARIHTRALVGVSAPPVSVEVHLSGGLPQTSIVGLPELAVREARDRVRAAIINAQFDYPQRRITISLAPADLPKEGSRFDLAIAMGILVASGQVPGDRLARMELVGELGLSGELRAVRGVLPAVLAAQAAGRAIVVPSGNAAEAARVVSAEAFCAESLLALCASLCQRRRRPSSESANADPDAVSGIAGFAPACESPQPAITPAALPDLADVRGQAHARRALEVAAAGQHNLVMIGPPGSGKTMLAQRLAGILPGLEDDAALECAAIASVSAQGFDPGTFGQRPTRAPHHTASAVALVGGGSVPRPGEISLAHHGVLFLDELPEFDRRVLEVLREPLESGRILISRAARQAEFPARFQLVAAMNPCPCGYAGDTSGRCRCSPDHILRYRSRISGPLLDRIDLHVEVPRLPHSDLRGGAPVESSASVRERVMAARRRQLTRVGKPNALLASREIELHCALSQGGQDLLERAVERLGLSARGYHRILRVARTIADLAAADTIADTHLAEAIGYRRLDRSAPSAHGYVAERSRSAQH